MNLMRNFSPDFFIFWQIKHINIIIICLILMLLDKLAI